MYRSAIASTLMGVAVVCAGAPGLAADFSPQNAAYLVGAGLLTGLGGMVAALGKKHFEKVLAERA